MSSEDMEVDRRTVLKKGAAAATVAAGGVAATSGSAAAADWGYLRIQGQGNYQIQVYADDYEVVEPGVSYEVETSTDHSGEQYYILSGEVNGEINSSPNDYAQFKLYGSVSFDTRTWDSGVDVYWKGNALSES